jgi:hypothetical protein
MSKEPDDELVNFADEPGTVQCMEAFDDMTWDASESPRSTGDKLEVADGPPHWTQTPEKIATFTIFTNERYYKQKDEAEIFEILFKAFENCFRDSLGVLQRPKSLQDLLDDLKKKTGYEIISVTRIQNKYTLGMQNSMKRIYGIKNSKIVYHGTTSTAVLDIIESGLKSAAGQRGVHGKGVYGTTDIWLAGSYAPPNKDMTQVVLVVDMLDGECREGSENLVNFGRNPQNGKPYVMCKDPSGKIFVAGYDSLVRPQYAVQMRFDFTMLPWFMQKTPAAIHPLRYYVKHWHPDVSNQIHAQCLLIKNQALAMPGAGGAGAGGAGAGGAGAGGAGAGGAGAGGAGAGGAGAAAAAQAAASSSAAGGVFRPPKPTPPKPYSWEIEKWI